MLAVEAPNNNPSSTKTGAGHVRVYRYVNGAWTQLGSDIDREAAGDNSGVSLSNSSDGMVVAIGANDNSPTTATTDYWKGHV